MRKYHTIKMRKYSFEDDKIKSNDINWSIRHDKFGIQRGLSIRLAQGLILYLNIVNGKNFTLEKNVKNERPWGMLIDNHLFFTA